MNAGDTVAADLPEGRFEGTAEAFSASGSNALVRLSAPVASHPAGSLVPIPVRLLETSREEP